MSDVSVQPSGRSFWLSTFGVIGCFLVFAVVLKIAYLPTRTTQVGPPANLTTEQRLELGLLTPGERTARLSELRGKESTGLTNYTWIDKDKGLVHLPIDRAIELTVVELKK